MTNPKIVVVIPTIREESYRSFLKAWEHLFLKHKVTLVTVWDGETPHAEIWDYGTNTSPSISPFSQVLYSTHKNLIYRYTDACRNLGFIVAAHLKPDYVLTLDDDVAPFREWEKVYTWDQPKSDYKGMGSDPIQAHLDVLQRKAPLSWINTAHDTELYLRGMPYNIRNESPVMLSHGIWVGTPDFDGETQLKLERCTECGGQPYTFQKQQFEEPKCVSCNGSGKLKPPYSLPYYVGPVPKGVLFPLCGMSVMVRAEALPYLYFAPMGKDTSIDNLNRFADIWMGVSLKKKFDELGWACYTGGSTILHTRASDAKKNFEQEKLGREWNEHITDYVNTDCQWRSDLPEGFVEYMTVYRNKREQFAETITSIFLNK